MAGRPKAQLVLSEVEREQLVALTLRRKTAQALALRARIVLACADGADNQDVAARQRVTKQTVSKWRARFVDQRLDGLLDAPRVGAPRSIDDARVDALIAKTLESTPTDATHWSTRSMARDTLRTIDANVPAQLDIHLVMDNYGTHKTPTIKAWFARHPRFHVHFTPTSASWLNQVERWFATLTEKYIRRGTHRSTRQLEQAIKQYLNINNSNPKPFVWAKSADDILASIERFCLRISNSRH